MAEANQTLGDRRYARDQVQHSNDPEQLVQLSTAALATVIEFQAQLLRTCSDGLMAIAQSIDANIRTRRDRAA